MRIAIVGGKLQGVEIAYLAKKANYSTLLIDRNLHTPATGICDDFLEFHFKKEGRYPRKIGKVDLIFPALEDAATLHLLKCWAEAIGVPIVLDLEAYLLSSSKNKSNDLFQSLNLPLPGEQNSAGFPLLVKPDNSSGSDGVKVVHSQTELDQLLENSSGEFVVQQYLDGPSFSVEVIGSPGKYVSLQATDLFMDERYDCCGVAAPTSLEGGKILELHNQVVAIAEAVSLHGIMDLEVILHEGKLKILEIDARFPSQTPIAVYHSTGMNMVVMLANLFLYGQVATYPGSCVHCRVDHVQVEPGSVKVLGEHIMAEHGPLRLAPGLFGADDTITTYQPGKNSWVATFIFRGDSREEVEAKRQSCLQKIDWIQPLKAYPDDPIIAQRY